MEPWGMILLLQGEVKFSWGRLVDAMRVRIWKNSPLPLQKNMAKRVYQKKIYGIIVIFGLNELTTEPNRSIIFIERRTKQRKGYDPN